MSLLLCCSLVGHQWPHHQALDILGKKVYLGFDSQNCTVYLDYCSVCDPTNKYCGTHLPAILFLLHVANSSNHRKLKDLYGPYRMILFDVTICVFLTSNRKQLQAGSFSKKKKKTTSWVVLRALVLITH